MNHIRANWRSARALVCVVAICIQASSSIFAEQTIKLLTVGNSYAENSTEYLKQVAESCGVTLKLGKANLGGARLQRHADHLFAFLEDPNDPEGSPYRVPGSASGERQSLVDLLRSEDWDFVTIQQYSGHSFMPESYEPHAARIVEAIRRFAPQARILIHETWAYRQDHPFFESGAPTPDENSRVEVDQESMYAGLRSAYSRLARRYDLGIVPVGTAFQVARGMPLWKFETPDPDFNYENPQEGELPDQSGSLQVGWYWRTDSESGEKEFRLDASHANVAGRYLGACVFFARLSGQSALSVKWQPETLSEAQAKSLRIAASLAVESRANVFSSEVASDVANN